MARPGKSSPVQQNKKVSEKAKRGTPRSWGMWRCGLARLACLPSAK
jgi:hypothetical protein